jgi:hypothetical protein
MMRLCSPASIPRAISSFTRIISRSKFDCAATTAW